MTTYKRPAWLRQALATLLEQTHPHWVALVFDDSPGQEGRAVVEELADSRLSYDPNPRRLGCTGNLNRAFQTRAYQGGNFACVLEDDNWFYPEFLQSNLAALRAGNARIMQRNQQVWSRYSEPPQPTAADCLGHWYGADALLSPLQLHAYMFLFPGVSNGALFWDTRAASDLQVDEKILDASLQEYVRCAQIQEPVVFASRSLAAWADVPVNQARGAAYSGREFGRFLQHLRRQLYAHYGRDIVEAVRLAAQRAGRDEEASRQLLNSLILDAGNRCSPGETMVRLGRGAIKLAFTKNIAPSYRIPFVESATRR